MNVFRTNSRMRWAAVLLMGGASLGTTVVVGCASEKPAPPVAKAPPPPPPDEVPMEAMSGLIDVREQLVQGKVQVQRTSKAARDMTSKQRASQQRDVKAQVEQFSRELASLEKMSTQARAGYAGATTQASQYFANWDTKLQNSSEALAKMGQERRSRAISTFAKLKAQVAAVRSEFQPYMTELKESEDYIKTDSTSQGVTAATPTIQTALGREPKILSGIDGLIAQIDSMRGGAAE
jgi:hypothetical protein